MAEEMAELTATGSPTAEGPVSRQDSAHDMAQGEGSTFCMLTPCGHPHGFGKVHICITCLLLVTLGAIHPSYVYGAGR